MRNKSYKNLIYVRKTGGRGGGWEFSDLYTESKFVFAFRNSEIKSFLLNVLVNKDILH